MKFELFKSSNDNQWYWRFQAANGKSIAVGGEGYHNRMDALASMNNLRMTAASSPVWEQQPDGHWRAI